MCNDGKHDYMQSLAELQKYEPQLYKIIKFKYWKQFINSNIVVNVKNIVERFAIFDLYVWQGLTEEKIINKMLKLNVGQKCVMLTHQFELLYLYMMNHIHE